jgi:hypothetical protein
MHNLKFQSMKGSLVLNQKIKTTNASHRDKSAEESSRFNPSFVRQSTHNPRSGALVEESKDPDDILRN